MPTPLLYRLPLRVILPVVIALFAVIAGSVAYLHSKTLLDDKIKAQALFDTRQQLSLAQGVLETFLRAGDLEAAQRLIASFGSDGSTQVALLTGNTGEIIASTRFSDVGLTPAGRGYRINPDIVARTEQTRALETLLQPEADRILGIVSICGPVNGQGLRPDACGYLYVDKRLSYFAERSGVVLGRQAVQAAVGFGLASLFLWLLLHAVVTRRAQVIIATVGRFADRDRKARTRLTGGDEIARIGQAVDSMLDHIVASDALLREDEALRQAVLDGVAEGIITYLPDGHILAFNPGAERIFGHAAGLAPRNVADLLALPREAEKLFINPANETQDELERVVELMAMHGDGSTLCTEWSLRRSMLDDREIITAVVRNVTEMKKLASMQREFTSVVSHELRTPLTSLHGSLRMLAAGVVAHNPVQAQQLLEVAERNSKRLLNLVNDILDMQKLGAEAMQFEMKDFDMAELAHDSIEANRGFFAKYGVDCQLDNHASDTRVHGDQFRIEQVITNLLSNAAKYSPAGQCVTVTLDDDAAGLRLSVSDHGRGIPESFRERIFDPFFQVDSSDSREKEGTGLGLSICNAIITRHGGHLDFTSQPGTGTTFFFTIPIAAQANTAQVGETATGARG